MTIKQLIERGNEGLSGTAGAWRVRANLELGIVSLHHHSTRMLQWELGNPSNSDVLDWSLGWGSVSDQNGMNTAFRVLGLPYYYSRKGGAHIVSLNDSRESARDLPVYIRRHPELHLGRERGSLVTQ